MIIHSHVKKICEVYSLGQPLRDIKPVQGGLLHQLFFLKTTVGEYAVKWLSTNNQALLRHNLLSPEKSQRIAKLMQMQHVPTLVALQQRGRFVFEYELQRYLILPWIQGKTLTATELSLSSLEKIGTLVAVIHESHVDELFSVPRWAGLDEGVFRNAINHVAKINKTFYRLLVGKADLICLWSQQAHDALSILNKQLVFSHRDLDPRNVIWQNADKPILIDWEYAGLINPLLDLFIVALNWSNVLTGKIIKENFQAIVRGFIKVKKTTEPLTPLIINGYLGYCLDWFQYNLRQLQSLNSRVAITELQLTLTAIETVIHEQETLINWFNMDS